MIVDALLMAVIFLQHNTVEEAIHYLWHAPNDPGNVKDTIVHVSGTT